ncbi:hypothetical protein GCM10009654_34930 [Streptomyces hebeiensis]|uniref:Uncharacterized protein n=1 Tax=Streptomyces hebeiensis TaxID=229486 RepID=A0ABP4FFW9_9ACTN
MGGAIPGSRPVRDPKDPVQKGDWIVKGDRVEIVVDAGDTTRTYEVVASRAGRRVETAVRRGVVEVSEVTRSGAVVRTARFMASRVLALVEQPAPVDAPAQRPSLRESPQS